MSKTVKLEDVLTVAYDCGIDDPYFKDCIDALPDASQWIDVRDGMPDIDTMVMVYEPFNGCVVMHASLMSEFSKITHW